MNGPNRFPPVSPRRYAVTLLPYWRAPAWRHPAPPPDTSIPGRIVATKGGVPIYSTRGALIYPALMVVMMALGVVYGHVYPALAGGVGPALAAGFDAAIIVGVIPHEMAHGFMARRAGQTIGSARMGSWGASVVWGGSGEAIAPRDLAVIAAAGPVTNLVLAVGTLIAALATHGNARAFLAAVCVLNIVFLATNGAPIRARRKPGQRRIGTDGAIVARAVHAARLGPEKIDMLAPRAPTTDPAGSGT